MFTGLIEEMGIIQKIEQTGAGKNITVTSNKVLQGIKIGDSITIEGACQTVTKIGDTCFTIFASKVTCKITTLGTLKIGKKVNLERSLLATSRLDGHIVQGHIDGKGKIKSILTDENGLTIEIEVVDDLLKYIVEKGSVAISGVSLTVVSLTDTSLLVYIIPETLKNTTLIEIKTGDEINIEVDILAKYVEKMLTTNSKKGDSDKRLKEKLAESGFI